MQTIDEDRLESIEQYKRNHAIGLALCKKRPAMLIERLLHAVLQLAHLLRQRAQRLCITISKCAIECYSRDREPSVRRDRVETRTKSTKLLGAGTSSASAETVQWDLN